MAFWQAALKYCWSTKSVMTGGIIGYLEGPKQKVVININREESIIKMLREVYIIEGVHKLAGCSEISARFTSEFPDQPAALLLPAIYARTKKR